MGKRGISLVGTGLVFLFTLLLLSCSEEEIEEEVEEEIPAETEEEPEETEEVPAEENVSDSGFEEEVVPEIEENIPEESEAEVAEPQPRGVSPVGSLPDYPTTPLGEAFEEDFAGSTLNEELWEMNDGYKYWDSWYDGSKVSVSNKVLKLGSNTADKTTDSLLKVGGIKSAAFYSYGIFTFKAKINPAVGMVSALFLYNEDKDMGEGGTHEEIDVELSSTYPCTASLVTYHQDDWTSADLGLQNEMHRGGIKDICQISGLEDFDSRKLNTYVIDWQPGKITWYINGIEVEELRSAVPTTPMHFSLDTYNTHEWDAFVEPTPSGVGVLEIEYASYVPYER